MLKTLKWTSENYKHRLTIDRKDSSLGYLISNIVLCCMTCNMAKNEVLSVNETKKVGGVLKVIWQTRAKKWGIKF